MCGHIYITVLSAVWVILVLGFPLYSLHPLLFYSYCMCMIISEQDETWIDQIIELAYISQKTTKIVKDVNINVFRSLNHELCCLRLREGVAKYSIRKCTGSMPNQIQAVNCINFTIRHLRCIVYYVLHIPSYL